FRTPRSQGALLAALAIDAAAMAIFSIVQQRTWNGQLYWSIPLTQGGLPFGPFINRNNGAAFLNLGLAAAVGIVAWALAPRLSREESSAGSRFGRGLLAALGLTIALAILAAIVCSLSRGGFVACVVGCVVTASSVFYVARS